MDTRGVNARWVATEADTTISNISRYCSGSSSPEILNIIVRVAKVLNVSIDYLLGATTVMAPAPTAAKDISEFDEKYSHIFGNPDFQMYVGVYNDLPPKSQMFLAEFVRNYGINQNVLEADGKTPVTDK